MTEEDAIKRIKDFGLYHAIKDLPHSMRTVEAFEMAIEALKRQEANKPRNGKWIVIQKFEDCYYAKCNECKVTQVFYHNKALTNYCPNCGCKMEE